MVENTFRPVASDGGIVLASIGLALPNEPTEVGTRSNAVCRKALQCPPFVGHGCIGHIAQIPLQPASQRFDIGQNGKEWRGLNVGSPTEIVHGQSAQLQPLLQRLTHVFGAFVKRHTAKRIAVAVGPKHILGFANGRNVHALPFGKMYIPLIDGHTGNHIARSVLPCFGHAGIFNPDIFIGIARPALHTGVLCENRRMVLHFFLNDEPLVLHAVLNGHGGSEQFGGGSEMIKLATGQR